MSATPRREDESSHLVNHLLSLSECHPLLPTPAGSAVCMSAERTFPQRSPTAREESDEQPANIPHMPSTPEVSQPERSRDASEAQPENMKFMRVTREVSHPERSRDASDEQPANMLPMY